MQNAVTFTGVLIAGIGLMMFLIGLPLASISDIPGLVSLPLASLPIIESSFAVMILGMAISATGLFLNTRERSTKRWKPQRELTLDDLRARKVLRIEFQRDGRTKYYYEGGETEIF
jgi:hypothetical protein